MPEEHKITVVCDTKVRFNQKRQLVYISLEPDEAFGVLHMLLKNDWFGKPILGVCFTNNAIPLLFCGTMLQSYLSSPPVAKRVDVTFMDML